MPYEFGNIPTSEHQESHIGVDIKSSVVVTQTSQSVLFQISLFPQNKFS